MPRPKIVHRGEHEGTAVDVLVGMGASSHSFEIYRQVRQTRMHTGINYRQQKRGGVSFPVEKKSTDCSLRIETTEKKKHQTAADGRVLEPTAKPQRVNLRKRKRVQGCKRSDCPKERKRKTASEWQ